MNCKKINFKKIAIYFCLIGVLAFIIILFSGIFVVNAKYSEKDFSKYFNNIISPEYENTEIGIDSTEKVEIEKNKNYSLSIVPSKDHIYIKDLNNDYEWSNLYSIDKYDGPKIPKTKRDLGLLFVIFYTDFKGEDGTINNQDFNFTKTYKKIKNGLAIQYSAENIGISLEFQLWLQSDGSFLVKIPRSSIKENMEYGIVKIDIMPTFGAANSSEEGYFYYPDGSGGIYDFRQQSLNANPPIVKDIYNALNESAKKINEDKGAGLKNIILPSFGTAFKNNAFIAYITEGDYASTITLMPFGNILKLNRQYASVHYRRYYTIIGPDKKIITEIDKDILVGDFSIRYGFLNNKDANYSGMAKNLQSFLIDFGYLKKDNKLEYKTELEFMCSVLEKGMLVDNIISTTKFMDVKKIVSSLKSKNLAVLLLGWQENGYGKFPSHGGVNANLGGKSDLSKLIEDLKVSKISTYLHSNYYLANSNGKWYSKQTDVINNQVGIPISDEKGEMFLLNPFKQLSRFNKNIKLLFELEPTGLLLDGPGLYLANDHSKNNKILRDKSQACAREMLSKTIDNGFEAVVMGGNAYALKYSNKLFNIPLNDSNYTQITREIPFYQLVLSGLYTFTSEVPGNLSPDFNKEKLKWIEFGANPYFILTNTDSSEIKDSYAADLFSTKFDDWKDLINKTIDEFDENIFPLYKEKVVKHTILKQNLIEIEFGNKDKIIINYSAIDEKIYDSTIKANSYQIIKWKE